MVPTTENIAIAAWRRLEPAVTAAGGAQLSRIRVYETPEIFAEYRGGAMSSDRCRERHTSAAVTC